MIARMLQRLACLLLAVAIACTGSAAWGLPQSGQGGPAVQAAGSAPSTPHAPILSKDQVAALVAAAEQQIASSNPVVSKLGEKNLETARRIQRVLDTLLLASHDLLAVEDRIEDTRRSMAADQERVRLPASEAGPVTALLSKHRSQLPSERDMRLAISDAQKRAAAAEISRIDLSDEVAQMRDPVKLTEQLLRGVQLPEGASDNEVVRAIEMREREYLIPLLAVETDLAELLAQLVQRQNDLAALASSYRAFIVAQLLWLPSDSHIASEESLRSWADAHILVSQAYWQDVLHGFRESVRAFPERWGASVLVLLVLLAYRRRMVRMLVARGEQVGSPTDRFTNTLHCLGLTVLLATPLPAAMWMWGNLLAMTPEPSQSASALARALGLLVPFMTLLALMREVTRPMGLGLTHFGWGAQPVQALRSGALLVGKVTVPLVALGVLALQLNSESTSSALGRTAIIVAMGVLSAATYKACKPTTGVFAGIIARRPKGGVAALSGLWFPALVAGPILLALGAAAGYVVTTLILLRHIVDTYWVVFGLALGLSLLERLFQSTSERFAWRRGLDTEETRRQAEQVSRVVRLATTVCLVVGLMVAWGAVVPSLDFLKSSTLWAVGGGENGELKYVTLRDLIVFGVVAVLTIQLVRDLPGVLGVALLQRFPLDASARYAIVAVGRYVLVLAGVFAAFASLKIGWSNVQWLAAAVSVGLGFGLQEIFANFVSGLIMLAERPVRIGDIVTVDTVTGRVTNIATRATTLVDADEREIIIPNRMFITTRITNWTLGDTPVRYIIEVGVDYGSDLRRAEELLIEAIRSMPLVLTDPAPGVVLKRFGASSIDFDAMYYVAHPRDALPARHAIIMRMDALLRANGIGIAYPQMDLHIRSWPSPPGAPAAPAPQPTDAPQVSGAPQPADAPSR
jgi:potassium-dependent mechanosensitive channel